MLLEEKVAHRFIATGKTLAAAESCTGGLLAHRLTNVPGSSAFLELSLVVYSNKAKIKFLGVSSSLLKKHGAVSSEVAASMASGARNILKSDVGVGITGIAGPSGGSAEKPVGLTFIAIATPQRSICIKCRFHGSRSQIKSQAVNQALRILSKLLSSTRHKKKLTIQ